MELFTNNKMKKMNNFNGMYRNGNVNRQLIGNRNNFAQANKIYPTQEREAMYRNEMINSQNIPKTTSQNKKILNIENEKMQSGEPFEHNGVTIYPVNEKNIQNLIESFKNPTETTSKMTSEMTAEKVWETTPETKVFEANQNKNGISTKPNANITETIENKWDKVIEDEINGMDFYNFLDKLALYNDKSWISRILNDKYKNLNKIFHIYNKLFKQNIQYNKIDKDFKMSFAQGLEFAVNEEFISINNLYSVYDEYCDIENDSISEIEKSIFEQIINRKIYNLLYLLILLRK